VTTAPPLLRYNDGLRLVLGHNPQTLDDVHEIVA